MMKYATTLALGLALSTTALAADLPDVEMVMKKYFEACGGKAKMAAVKSQVQKGTLTLTDFGMQAVYTDYTARPNSVNMSEFQGQGVAQNGLTDGYSWSVNPFQGNSVNKTGTKAAIFPAVYWDLGGATAECTGEGTVGDDECYEVTLTPAEGTASILSYSKESGFLVQMKQNTAVTSLSNYKEVNGIKVAHRIVQTGELNLEINLDSVELDVDIPEGTFDIPAEIKEIIVE